MEIEAFKNAWQKHSRESNSAESAVNVSRSIHFLRSCTIRDQQRSDELSRLTFSFLFALVAAGVSIVFMTPGAGRIAAWLLAATLLIDGMAGIALLVRRLRQPATATMLEFISREYCHAGFRLRLERNAQTITIVLGIVALLLLISSPQPSAPRENAFDILGRMAIITAFLGFAWMRVRSRSSEIRHELEHSLKDLQSNAPPSEE